MRSIDLNVDVGEGFPNDGELIPLASSANIACGGHAGDAATMCAAIEIAIKAGTHIGAHPGYEDRENFGRVVVDLPARVIARQVVEQIDRLAATAESMSTAVRHVKLHGALYHEANQNAWLAEAIMSAIAERLPGCRLIAPPEGCQKTAAIAHGLIPIAEGFADRGYASGGNLLPRDAPGARIDEPSAAVRQAIELAGSVESICIHGDSRHAARILTAVRQALEAKGYGIG
jgi:UPF0271 protein